MNRIKIIKAPPITVNNELCEIDAALHKSLVHEQKEFITSNVPDFLTHPRSSLSVRI